MKETLLMEQDFQTIFIESGTFLNRPYDVLMISELRSTKKKT